MNFDFNIGAIVKLGIFGFATPLYKLGKVIEVTPTEVVIVPQLNVCRESDNGPSSFDEYCIRQMPCTKFFILGGN